MPLVSHSVSSSQALKAEGILNAPRSSGRPEMVSSVPHIAFDGPHRNAVTKGCGLRPALYSLLAIHFSFHI